MSDRLNFTYDLTNPPDGAWGLINSETGIWDGMTGQAARGEVDFCMADITMQFYRIQVTKF